MALGARMDVVTISTTAPIVKRIWGGWNKKGGKTPVLLLLRQCSLAFLLYATWACQGRVLLDVEGGR